METLHKGGNKMNATIELTEAALRKLFIEELHKKLGDLPFETAHVSILVKSKQNYRAE